MQVRDHFLGPPDSGGGVSRPPLATGSCNPCAYHYPSHVARVHTLDEKGR